MDTEKVNLIININYNKEILKIRKDKAISLKEIKQKSINKWNINTDDEKYINFTFLDSDKEINTIYSDNMIIENAEEIKPGIFILNLNLEINKYIEEENSDKDKDIIQNEESKKEEKINEINEKNEKEEAKKSLDELRNNENEKLKESLANEKNLRIKNEELIFNIFKEKILEIKNKYINENNKLREQVENLQKTNCNNNIQETQEIFTIKDINKLIKEILDFQKNCYESIKKELKKELISELLQEIKKGIKEEINQKEQIFSDINKNVVIESSKIEKIINSQKQNANTVCFDKNLDYLKCIECNSYFMDIFKSKANETLLCVKCLNKKFKELTVNFENFSKSFDYKNSVLLNEMDDQNKTNKINNHEIKDHISNHKKANNKEKEGNIGSKNTVIDINNID